MWIQLTYINTETKLALFIYAICLLKIHPGIWSKCFLCTSPILPIFPLILYVVISMAVWRRLQIIFGFHEDIPPRICLYQVKKRTWWCIVGVYKGWGLAILNGRISPTVYNFTCVLHRGKSMVDYMLIRYDCWKFCLDFKVELMSDIIEAVSCSELLSNACKWLIHYNDVIMSAMSSQITSHTIVYSTVYSDADQRKHQSSASLAFVRGIHRGPVNSPHKWPVTRKMLPFDDVIILMTVKMANSYGPRSDEITSQMNAESEGKIYQSMHITKYSTLIATVRTFITFMEWGCEFHQRQINKIQHKKT